MEVNTIVLQDMARANPKSHNLTAPPRPVRRRRGVAARGGRHGPALGTPGDNREGERDGRGGGRPRR